MQHVEDPLLPELLIQLRRILDGTRLWAQGADLPTDCEAARHKALLLNHRRYLHLIPVYGKLAESQNIGDLADIETLINTLLFPSDIFKSYKPQWLEERDFPSMTTWLRTVFSGDIPIDASGVTNIGEWVRRLEAEKIFVTCSSGTSGRFSFVPRDAATFQSVRTNGSYYHHSVWRRDEYGRYPDFDCLILGSRGTDMGIQGAGTGLSQMAKRSHFLLDTEVSADIVFAAARGRHKAQSMTSELLSQSFEFLRVSIADGRRVLMFGPPFQVKAFCDRVAAEVGRLALPPGSILVSGGGWKSFTGQSIPQAELQNLVEATLAIPPAQVIDTYSSAELNCVFMTCGSGRYHIPPLVEPVVVDEMLTGTAGREGHGTLAFLDPFALSYPGFLISGDSGFLSREHCECGLKGWSIIGEIRRAANQEIRGCGAVMASVTA